MAYVRYIYNFVFYPYMYLYLRLDEISASARDICDWSFWNSFVKLRPNALRCRYVKSETKDQVDVLIWNAAVL